MIAHTEIGKSRVVEHMEPLTFSNLVGALTYALDMTEGARPGHALRTCLLGMRIGEELNLSRAQLSDLYYALLLKDAGCSSNATRLQQIVGGDEIRAKAFSKTNDWTRLDLRQIRFLLTQVHATEKLPTRLKAMHSMLKNSSTNAETLIRLRCNQGAAVVQELGLGIGTSEALYSMDEHWNGAGYPDHLVGESIPLLSRIISVAQTLDVFRHEYGLAAALDCIQRRSGRWFDPGVVKAAVSLIARGALWSELPPSHLKRFVASLEPSREVLPAEDAVIDRICFAFAGIIDAKSQSTFRHSREVARIAVQVAEVLGLAEEDRRDLHRAGLLHDVGKLSVPNSILEKPGKLDAAEWACVKAHPRFTHEILNRIPGFDRIANVAASHHEKLDGSGYYRALHGDQICTLSRVLTVADMFEALSAERSYRGKLPTDEVLAILHRDVPHALDPDCFGALKVWALNREEDPGTHADASLPAMPEPVLCAVPVNMLADWHATVR